MWHSFLPALFKEVRSRNLSNIFVTFMRLTLLKNIHYSAVIKFIYQLGTSCILPTGKTCKASNKMCFISFSWCVFVVNSAPQTVSSEHLFLWRYKSKTGWQNISVSAPHYFINRSTGGTWGEVRWDRFKVKTSQPRCNPGSNWLYVISTHLRIHLNVGLQFNQTC